MNPIIANVPILRPNAKPSETDVKAAFAHCETLAQSHYENFPVGSRIIPAALRPHVYSIYAFARTADDFADEPGLEPSERLARLQKWGRHLDTCLNTPEGPIFTALAETIRTHQIPKTYLHDLLHAFKMDVITARHPTFNHLLSYCRYSAAPVGRLILHLFGYRDAQRRYYSDLICTALQLTNFWQDIAIDFSRGRIYLPQEDMYRFNISEDALATGRVTHDFKTLLASEIARTETLFQQGCPLPDMVTGRLRYELRLTWLGGMEILNQIRQNQYDIFHHRPQVAKKDVFRLIFRMLLWKHIKAPCS